MRIAILSLQLNTNYGGILQAYALQTLLERLGHDVCVIDNQAVPDIRLSDYIKVIPIRFIYKYILGKRLTLWPEQHYRHKQYLEKSINTRRFIFEHINIRKCKSLSRLRKNEFDAIVVGSDQVWRPSYFCCWGDVTNSFLKFAKDWSIRRISYAASFGTDKWEYSENETFAAKKLIKMFDAVSVREYDGVLLCKKYLNTDADLVLDPTLLLTIDDYDHLINDDNRLMEKRYLLYYCLDNSSEICTLTNNVSYSKGLIPYKICNNERHGNSEPIENVEIWLKAFRDADFIITDSFHACVFSLIFRKPFICICNKSRGESRFRIFIEELGLKHNFVSKASEYVPTYNYMPKEETYNKLSELKMHSCKFLKNSLR